jgi:hypothetical protein
MSEQRRPTTEIDCIECNRATTHEILYTENVGGYVEDSGIHWGADYHTVQCCGCKTISFAARSWNSEDTDPEGQPIHRMVLYPSRTIRKPMENYYYLPNKVRGVYQETLTALSNAAPILAAIGIRAVVEAVCKDKGCSGHDLEKNIDLLVKKGHLASDQADFLHLQRFMGNAAAHEIVPPEQTELRAALDIAENLLTNLYVLPLLAQEMKRSQTQLTARNARLRKSTLSAEKEG